MADIEFTNEDFENLEFIEKFNKEHWKAVPAALGRNYDVDKTDPQIQKIRDSLHLIKNKLLAISEHLKKIDEFKDLRTSVQKITDSRTVRYLSHLWVIFVKGVEKKIQNEPQLQITIGPQDINVSIWFENAYVNKNYLAKFISDYEDNLKDDDSISFEVYEAGVGAGLIKQYANNEWASFVNKMNSLDYNFKVGFTNFIPRETVLQEGDNWTSPSIVDIPKSLT